MDFESVDASVVGAQCITATMLTSFLSVAMDGTGIQSQLCTADADHNNSRRRRCDGKALRITKSRGLDHVFRASRPGVSVRGQSRRGASGDVLHAGTAATIVAKSSEPSRHGTLLVGGLSVLWPLGDRDLVPFVISTACLLVLAMWPWHPPWLPLRFVLSILGGARLARGIVFSVVYSARVRMLASQPRLAGSVVDPCARRWRRYGCFHPTPNAASGSLAAPVVVSRRSQPIKRRVRRNGRHRW